MSIEPIQSHERELVHILFLDVVGYSRMEMDEQPRVISRLQEIVRKSEEFRRAEASGSLIRLPTGDGVALVFFDAAAAPARCALQIGRALQEDSRIQLRMGIHTGPVHRIADINAQQNVSGSGINVAQRVMECGDPGHILVSHVTANLLQQVDGWEACLYDLGECEVKHGSRVHVYNLYAGDVGNRQPPRKLLDLRFPGAAETFLTPGIETAPASKSRRVMFLYKHGAEPDEALMNSLERQLVACGHQVFKDRNLRVGVEWAREIERQICSSDAVIPLISAASAQSEMFEYEISVAQQAGCLRGRPRILPVRVAYRDPLPPSLAAILDPVQYVLWEGCEDDRRIVDELLAAVDESAAPDNSSPLELEAVGGAVPVSSKFYVVRPADMHLQEAMARKDSIILIKGAGQMGKTSLMVRALKQAKSDGSRIVLTNFQTLNSAYLDSPRKLLLCLAESIVDQLDLDTFLDETWDERRTPNRNFDRFLRRHVLDPARGRVVWAMDEVDRLFGSPFCSEVFGLFRSWHNERALEPDGSWSLLTLLLSYSSEARLFIPDVNQSPFNVGTLVPLDDLTLDQVEDLNYRYGSPLRNSAEVARFYRLIAGHPFLTRRGLDDMVGRKLDIMSFEAQAVRDDGPFGDHLRQILALLVRNQTLCDILKGMLQGQPSLTPESFYRLRSAGIITGEYAAAARPRCRLYGDYLSSHLL